MGPPAASRRSASCLQMACAVGFMLVLFCSESVRVLAGSESAAVRALGRIVYLPDVTLESEHNSDPLIFDADDLDTIATKEKSSYADMNSNWFEESKNFEAAIAADMGISGSYRGVELSVSSAFKKVTGQETNVKVADIHTVSFSSKTFVERGSKLYEFPLKSGFTKDFQSLPVVLENPHEDLAWAPFRDFMNKWGSHIVTAAYTGVVFQSWSSAKSEYNYKQWELEAKACVKAEGLKGKALQACAGFSESERESATKLQTTDTRRVRGGTVQTRTKLATLLATQELLEKFLGENDVDDQPVRYLYLSVWDFFLGRSEELGKGDDAKRARALQAYYEGWKATTCPLVVTEDQSNDKAQMFVAEYTEDRQPTGYYLCIRRCKGCHNYYKDCWYQAIGACCRSYGPSVLKPTGDPRDFVVRATDYYSGWCDWDNGCYYQVGSGCLCMKDNEENGCNYVYPLNPKDSTWLKYKIIWNQHSLQTSLPTIDSETNATHLVTDN